MKYAYDIMFDQKFHSSQIELDRLFDEKGMDKDSIVQSVVLNKEQFPKVEDAQLFLKEHYFLSTKYTDNKNSFEFIQLEKSQFTGTLKSMELRSGVALSCGKLKVFSQDDVFLKIESGEDSIQLSGDYPSVIQLARVMSGFHPRYGEITITSGNLAQMELNFNDNAVGVDLMIDYDHDRKEAAGWIRSVFLSLEKDILFGEIQWTSKGIQALSDREFRYFSPEYHKNYISPYTGEEKGFTLLGGGLTNRPFLRLDPVVDLNKGDLKMNTINLKDHQDKIAEYEKKLNEAVSLNDKSKELFENMTKSNKVLSDKISKLEDEKKKEELSSRNLKLFNDNKITKAQMVALNEGKEMYEVLEMGSIGSGPSGKTGNDKDAIALSDSDRVAAKKLGITEEDFKKYGGDK